MHDVVVGEGADHLADRIGLADVGEELVAQTLPLGRTAHDAGDVDEGDRRGDEPLGAEEVREHLQARVRQGDDAKVRLDRGERVVRGQYLVAGEGVEEGRLADVREADDSDGERHGRQVYGPRARRSPWANCPDLKPPLR